MEEHGFRDNQEDFLCKMIDEEKYLKEMKAIFDSIRKSINSISKYGAKFEEAVNSVHSSKNG